MYYNWNIQKSFQTLVTKSFIEVASKNLTHKLLNIRLVELEKLRIGGDMVSLWVNDIKLLIELITGFYDSLELITGFYDSLRHSDPRYEMKDMRGSSGLGVGFMEAFIGYSVSLVAFLLSPWMEVILDKSSFIFIFNITISLVFVWILIIIYLKIYN